MNVTLIFLSKIHNFDVNLSSSLSYLYEIASKVFNLHKNTMLLYYNNTQLPDNDKTEIITYFKELTTLSIQVRSTLIKLPQLNQSRRSTNNEDKRNCLSLTEIDLTNQSTSIMSPIKIVTKRRKQVFKQVSKVILCQLCLKRSSLYYCKKCNEFVCLECNTKYSEHIRHKLIEINNQNYEQTANIYQKDILNNLSILRKAYSKSAEWANIEELRSEYLNGFITKLKDIDLKAHEIQSTKVGKVNHLNNQLFYTYKEYVLRLLTDFQQSKNNKELQQIFSELNKKEKEIIQMISHVSLEVSKAKYNYKLINILSKIMTLLHELALLTTNTHNDCIQKNFFVEEIIKFNEDLSLKPLEYYQSFDDSFYVERGNLSNMKYDLQKDDKSETKPLFSKYIINQLSDDKHLHLSNRNNLTQSNISSITQILHNGTSQNTDSKKFLSNRLTTEGIQNENKKNNKQLCLSYKPRNCFSPNKNMLNIAFGDTKLKTDNEFIDSSQASATAAQRVKKKKTKSKSYSTELI